MQLSRRSRLVAVTLALLGLASASLPAEALAQGKPKPVKAAPQKPAQKAPPKAAPKKPAPAPKAKPAAKPKPGKPGKRPGAPGGEPDEAVRRAIAGQPARLAKESPELAQMRELDRALFPTAHPKHEALVAEGTVLVDTEGPRRELTGLPAAGLVVPEPAGAKLESSPRDLSWLKQLEMPTLPVRFDARVVRYLEVYKNDPRGRAMVQSWIKRSGRYGGMIRRVLREQGLPEDIVWLALVESGFEPTSHSPAGAAGLWQFMPDGARIYGLTVDRWLDERLDPERSTLAAARYLSDLHKRFGSWELAFAAYNMGYGGLQSAIKKYNTNDFWELAKLEAALPLETSLYVPKIIAMSIVARNKAVFGCDNVELDPAVTFDHVAVRSGVPLRALAIAAGAPETELESLNPQLLALRAPPLPLGSKADTSFTVRVPAGVGPKAAKSLSSALGKEPKLERVALRWGESLDELAAQRGVRRSTLKELNGIRGGEVVRPGTVLFVPTQPEAGVRAEKAADKPVVVVPAGVPTRLAGKKRSFFRVVSGDLPAEVALALGVTLADLLAWNALDRGATLHEGMTLQVFVEPTKVLKNALLVDESEVRPLVVGTDAFFAHFEAQKGRKRVLVTAREGDTLAAIGKKHGLSGGMMERINGRGRNTALRAGETVVVYVPESAAPQKPEPKREPDEAPAVAREDDATRDEPDDEAEPSAPEAKPAAAKDAPKVSPEAPKVSPEAPKSGPKASPEAAAPVKPATQASPTPPAAPAAPKVAPPPAPPAPTP